MILRVIMVHLLSIGVGGGVRLSNLWVLYSDLNIYEACNLIINIPCVLEMATNRLRYVIPLVLVPPRDDSRWSKNT